MYGEETGLPKGTRQDFFSRVHNFYRGMFLYGLGYVTFVALEFSLFEAFLQKIESWKEQRKYKKW